MGIVTTFLAGAAVCIDSYSSPPDPVLPSKEQEPPKWVLENTNFV